LYVGYGENGIYPGQGHVGYFDLTSPAPVEQLLPVTNGGVFFNYATRHSIRVSEDGHYVYTLEFGVDPGFPFSSGFANGSLVNVIDTRVNAEVAAVPSGLSAQRELAVDRMNEWVYVPGLEQGTSLGRVVGIDVREGSPARWSVPKNFLLDPLPYGEGTGGVAITPDGSTLYVSAIEDGQHPMPLVHVLDAATGTSVAPAITAESLPGTVSMQQR
ncbi:MAG: hypothetical protein H6833_07335, partial [Planctomycetes bacterium]|nr:hypothetical protein [Planctomycetota bacterium]